MAAGVYHLRVEQGATFRHPPFVWHHPGLVGSEELGAPVDLTGASARMQVRPSVGGPVMLDATSDNGLLVLGGVSGSIEMVFDAAATDGLVSSGVYDLEVEIPAGGAEVPGVYRVLQGRVRVDLNVTRDVPVSSGRGVA